ncbi:glycosyltransferase family 2 protein [Nocardia sp. NPDC049149]|uniref:glycosyltransferase family 2 protein n=1 Tax=Nocardia sp. NPDC049149 TaxID=3364315 RepID=UPI0037170DCA
MSQNRGISVLLPCHNSGDLIAEAVESVVQQPLSVPFEVIVVDDGSTDPVTLAAIENSSTHAGVRIVRLPCNRGAQAARNAGLDAAHFEYILPLDCDDRLATDEQLLETGGYLEPAVQILASRPQVAFVHTYSRMFEGFDGLTISAYPCREELLVRKHHTPMPIVYRRADALAAGGYDRRIQKWQDWAFAIDLMATRHRAGDANEIACLAGPFHEYRVHNRFSRLSTSQVSELEMTQLVVEKNLDYFRTLLGDAQSASELAAFVYGSKPDRLTDLLHMAAADLDQALTLARQRRATLTSRSDSLGIP